MAKLPLLAFSGIVVICSTFGLVACGSDAGSEPEPPQVVVPGAGGGSTGGTGGGYQPGDSGKGTGGYSSTDAAAGAPSAGGSAGEFGGSAGTAGTMSGGAGGAEDDGGVVGPQCPGIILGDSACDTEGLTCPNPCMDPCSCSNGVWSCSELCTCPDSNAHTADPCLSNAANCQFPITGTDDSDPYACLCQASNGYAMRWICHDKASQQPLCPEIPANWNCIDLGISTCLTAAGTCTCDPEGVFVCTP